MYHINLIYQNMCLTKNVFLFPAQRNKSKQKSQLKKNFCYSLYIKGLLKTLH